jgi:hypothetical protein
MALRAGAIRPGAMDENDVRSGVHFNASFLVQPKVTSVASISRR